MSNRARCLICGDIITSKHTHDFQTCSCGNLSVDGGPDYRRRCFKQGMDSWEEVPDEPGEGNHERQRAPQTISRQ